MRRQQVIVMGLGLVALAGGCGGKGQGTMVSVGPNSLAITELRIVETASSLEVDGLDSSQKMIGQLYLKVGPAVDGDGIAHPIGRTLVYQVNEHYGQHASAGIDFLLRLPMHPFPDMNAFFEIPQVVTALGR